MSNQSPLLVTGANGWLGKALIESLVQGHPDAGEYGKPTETEIRCFVLPGQETDFLKKP